LLGNTDPHFSDIRLIVVGQRNGLRKLSIGVSGQRTQLAPHRSNRSARSEHAVRCGVCKQDTVVGSDDDDAGRKGVERSRKGLRLQRFHPQEIANRDSATNVGCEESQDRKVIIGRKADLSCRSAEKMATRTASRWSLLRQYNLQDLQLLSNTASPWPACAVRMTYAEHRTKNRRLVATG
jgi:hypothetical protein